MALCSLLLLKEFLVRGYSLLPDRMRSFASATAEKRKLVGHVDLYPHCTLGWLRHSALSSDRVDAQPPPAP